MDEEQIVEFETLKAKLEGLYQEALTLSKKSPSDAFNKFKLRITNSVLVASNKLILETIGELPVDGFEQFDDTDLPVNSDVVFVLAQYLEFLENFRGAQIQPYGNHWYWYIDRQRSSIRTAAPRKL